MYSKGDRVALGMDGPQEAHHSVPIPDRYVDNTMTLYRLRRPSGRPPDNTKYMYYTRRRINTEYP